MVALYKDPQGSSIFDNHNNVLNISDDSLDKETMVHLRKRIKELESALSESKSSTLWFYDNDDCIIMWCYLHCKHLGYFYTYYYKSVWNHFPTIYGGKERWWHHARGLGGRRAIENVWRFCTPPDKHCCSLWSIVAVAALLHALTTAECSIAWRISRRFRHCTTFWLACNAMHGAQESQL